MATTNNISPSQGNSPTRTEREFTMNPTNITNLYGVNTNLIPRTVEDMVKLDRRYNKLDRCLDRATQHGSLDDQIRFDAQLSELAMVLAAVSDKLWNKYCDYLDAKEGAL